ncbi:MAG: CpaD family pilus assembly protein [Methylovirgula sp.]|nr:CpaD family pilus assembly protein [Methylovirgula sp.]
MPISPNRTAQTGQRAAKGRALLALGAAAALSGCASANVDRMRTSSIPMDDYRVRHPIVLSQSANRLDIFPPPEGYGLDRRSYAQVVQYGKLYRYNGQGPIVAFLPAAGYGTANRGTIESIRRALAFGGAHAPLQVTTYPVVNRDLASPIRLSFIGLKAKVADPCGQWPNDLASGSTLQGWQNKPYWNFGCSYQSMFAAQVADPRDLVGPRAEDASDTVFRTYAIDQLRAGKDPSTTWNTSGTSINPIGSTGSQ